jgi:hypothetical protein
MEYYITEPHLIQEGNDTSDVFAKDHTILVTVALLHADARYAVSEKEK